MSDSYPQAHRIESCERLRVLMLGATGTAGRATTHALVRAGHSVTCLVRKSSLYRSDDTSSEQSDIQDDISVEENSALVTSSADLQFAEAKQRLNLPANVSLRAADVTDAQSLLHDGFCEEQFDVLVSCLASRSGAPADAWEIDYKAHVNALAAAKHSGVRHIVLLSAICVQRPRLIFQQAKLAFENQLIDSGLVYSIVRPTAFFKSLSGQVERVRNGKPFLLFGDGALTACKPISDDDLGEYMAECIVRPERHNQILPIGGPGKAITPREQGEQLFAMTGRKPRFVKIPVAVVNAIRIALETGGKLSGTIADKAEFARIAHYYATESMLVFDHDANRYDADATPSTGTQTLFDYYAQLLDGTRVVERGEHAVFKD